MEELDGMIRMILMEELDGMIRMILMGELDGMIRECRPFLVCITNLKINKWPNIFVP